MGTVPSVALREGGKREQELFTLDELIREFSLDRINKNSPIFNIEKLNWFNKKYIQKLSLVQLTKLIKESSKRARTTDDHSLSKIIKLIQERLVTLAEFDKYASIFFEKGKQAPPPKSKIEQVKKAIAAIQNWNTASIAKQLDEYVLNDKLESADFKNTLRLAVFADNTPPIYESLAVLSKSEAEARIDHALKNSKN